MMRCITKNKTYIYISTIFLFILWEIIARVLDKPILVPTILDTIREILHIVTSGEFAMILGASLSRIIVAFLVSTLLALCLGILAGMIQPFYYLLYPVVLVQKSVPTMSIILLVIIWAGRELTPLVVALFIIFPVLYQSVVTAITHIDQGLLSMARLYRFTTAKIIRNIYLPVVKRSLLSVATVTIGLTMKVVIAAEVLSQPRYSIGTVLQIEKATLHTVGIFAWTIIAIIISNLLDKIVYRMEKAWIK